jgi:hypothetical protein
MIWILSRNLPGGTERNHEIPYDFIFSTFTSLSIYFTYFSTSHVMLLRYYH